MLEALYWKIMQLLTKYFVSLANICITVKSPHPFTHQLLFYNIFFDIAAEHSFIDFNLLF